MKRNDMKTPVLTMCLPGTFMANAENVPTKFAQNVKNATADVCRLVPATFIVPTEDSLNAEVNVEDKATSTGSKAQKVIFN